MTSIPYPNRARAVQALALLMLAAFLSFVDRQLLTLLVAPIKADLHISDVQIGLLQGFSFALFYSVMAMPFGWLADRTNRRNLVIGGILLWSAATLATGFARSYEVLLLARIFIGVGEASLMPAAYSLIADYFPPHQRGRAFSAFMVAVFAGGGGALIVGGAVLRALGHVTTLDLGPLGVHPVWQSGFIACGSFGILVAGLFLTLREPIRRVSDATPGTDTSEVSFSGYARQHWRVFASVWGIYTLLAFTAYALLPWAPTLLVRNHGLSLGAAGISVGAPQLIFGMIGSVIAGVLGDRWTRQARPGAKLRLTTVWWIGVIPALLLVTLSHDVRLVILGLALFSLFNGIGYVSGAAVIQDMVPGSLRGRTTAFWYLVTGVLGNGGGPMATAVVTQHVYGSEAALPAALLTVMLPAIGIGLMLSIVALRPYDQLRATFASGGHAVA